MRYVTVIHDGQHSYNTVHVMFLCQADILHWRPNLCEYVLLTILAVLMTSLSFELNLHSSELQIVQLQKKIIANFMMREGVL